MSTVIARRIAATPVRSASATWAKITDILASAASGESRSELERVRGVGAASVASESPRESAIVVHGGGPRVRLYCIFNDDAITGENVNEDPIQVNPLQDGWRMSIPFPKEDLAWATAELRRLSARITAREAGTEAESSDPSNRAAAPASATINVEEFLRS